MNNSKTAKKRTITMFFGEMMFDTLNDFDTLSKSLRRSRTGTLDYLIRYHEESEKLRRTPIFR